MQKCKPWIINFVCNAPTFTPAHIWTLSDCAMHGYDLTVSNHATYGYDLNCITWQCMTARSLTVQIINVTIQYTLSNHATYGYDCTLSDCTVYGYDCSLTVQCRDMTVHYMTVQCFLMTVHSLNIQCMQYVQFMDMTYTLQC